MFVHVRRTAEQLVGALPRRVRGPGGTSRSTGTNIRYLLHSDLVKASEIEPVRIMCVEMA